ncbi:hypothetical protein [Winogradskyella sp. KYW1333]|uniref:hypothetical protein n=1 Tax=Winogradskyella sp. KYW1333 TaxID=2282123 RepID=UPI000DF457AA|nr:hypothetical protein [Winogradskyella sp. KYW1333]RCT55860.1 hypothetical protein DUZ96_01915 [Winogradskyella sp. KYW1333]
MRFIKQLFYFYVNSSIHVAIAAYALTWVTLLEYNLKYDKNSLYFVFFATITGYNFVKYFGVAKFHHRRLADWLKAIQLFSLIAFIILAYYAFQLLVNSKILIVLLGVITFLYAIPLLPKKYFVDDQSNLRQISGLKVYVIAIVWSLSTVVLPLIQNEIEIGADAVVTCFQRFFYIIVLMLPFEIRDLNYDSLKLGTIPQRIGVKRTKIIGIFLLILFFFLEYFKNEIDTKSLTILLIITFVTALFLAFSNKNQSKYYSAFWVESLPIFWLVLFLILS